MPFPPPSPHPVANSLIHRNMRPLCRRVAHSRRGQERGRRGQNGRRSSEAVNRNESGTHLQLSGTSFLVRSCFIRSSSIGKGVITQCVAALGSSVTSPPFLCISGSRISRLRADMKALGSKKITVSCKRGIRLILLWLIASGTRFSSLPSRDAASPSDALPSSHAKPAAR